MLSLRSLEMAAKATNSSGRDIKDTKKLTDVEGYIHSVSPVKNPPSGNRYFDFKIQEREDNRRVVCFSSDKYDGIKEKEQCKSPVRLQNVSPQKRKYEPDSTEYKMNNYSKIMVTKNLSFPWRDIPGGSGTEKEVSVREIVNSCFNGDTVMIKAKVVWKGDSEIVFSRTMKKEITKCDIVVADSTGAIPATVWNDMIPNISNEKSYVFSEVRVSFFKRKYLSATQDCKANICEDISLSEESLAAAEQLKPKKKEIEDVNGKILAIDISKFYVCINCKNRMADEDDGNESQFVECSSCKLSMLKQNMTSAVSGSVMIVDQDGNNVGRFYCSGAVLNAMFTSISKTENYNIEETNVAQLSRKMIMETLLLVKNISFKVLKEDNVVELMEVLK